MRKQLQGISLILFGIMVMISSQIDKWLLVIVPIHKWIPGDLIQAIVILGGLILGIVGMLFSFKKET